MTNNIDFENAEALFNLGEFEKSFEAFNILANDTQFANEERAEAFNMMGVIISSVAPYLSTESSDGLYFYKKALTLNPFCVSALLNIVSSFGINTYSMHSDREVFIQAYNTLNLELYQNLTEKDKEDLNLKYQFYQSLDKQN